VRYAVVAGVGFDAVETANSAQAPFETVMGWNRVLAGRLKLPETGGSDSHIPETFGRSYTVVEAISREPEDVIKAIREGRTHAFGSGTSLGKARQDLAVNTSRSMAYPRAHGSVSKRFGEGPR
jgi:hypothetical protein